MKEIKVFDSGVKRQSVREWDKLLYAMMKAVGTLVDNISIISDLEQKYF
jgi:hypothetical protein